MEIHNAIVVPQYLEQKKGKLDIKFHITCDMSSTTRYIGKSFRGDATWVSTEFEANYKKAPSI